MKKYILKLCVMISLFLCFCIPMKADAKDLVIVIDPGHSGKNLGAEWGAYTEKNLTLKVANAMYEELSQFEGVKVYMTRTADPDLSLQERCDYANSVGADFMFCLHFNMSSEHDKWGTEVWIPSKGENYVKGYQFGSIWIEDMKAKGLFSRGIKTRINEKKDNEEYYGIIRHSEEYGFPCALLEHCHLDSKHDEPYYTSEDALKSLGKLDAHAVAKYFGLKSAALSVDYSGVSKVSVEAPTKSIPQDLTPADESYININSINQQTGEVTATLIAKDYQSCILYYRYSIDGGQTYSELYEYEKDGSTFSFQTKLNENIYLIAQTYNQYDQAIDTDVMDLGVCYAPVSTETTIIKEKIKESTTATETKESTETSESLENLETSETLETIETLETVESEETIIAVEAISNDIENNNSKNDLAEKMNTREKSASEKAFLIVMLLILSFSSVLFSALIAYKVARTKAENRRKEEMKQTAAMNERNRESDERIIRERREARQKRRKQYEEQKHRENE